VSSQGDGEELIRSIFALLAAILHLGNIECLIKDDESAKAEDEVVEVTCSTFSLSRLSKLLGVSEQQLLTSLTTQQIIIKGRSSIKIKVLSKEEVWNNVAALIKWIYSKLFKWLVKTINFSLRLQNDQTSLPFIGILDIFGFEILQTNSFEQLCINFTNERLQQVSHDIFLLVF
jgi:myosin heavy subunit